MSAIGMATLGVQCNNQAIGMASLGVICIDASKTGKNNRFIKHGEIDYLAIAKREDEELLFMCMAFIEVIRCR